MTTNEIKPAKFTSRDKAEAAALECMDNGFRAGVYGTARNWRVEAHGYNDSRTARIKYILSDDGRMVESGRESL